MFSSQLNPYEEVNPHLNSKQRHAISERHQQMFLFPVGKEETYTQGYSPRCPVLPSVSATFQVAIFLLVNNG